MPREPARSRVAKVKPGSDKRRGRKRSLSHTTAPLLASPGSSSSLSTATMNTDDLEKAIADCLAGDDFVNKIVDRLVDRLRDAVVETLSDSLNAARTEIAALKSEVQTLKKQLQKTENYSNVRSDQLEQYQRRNNLRIFGVPEKEGEDTDKMALSIFKEKLGVDLPLESVERSHRVGKHRSTDDGRTLPRPIIVKFLSYRDRRRVFDNKKSLKGTQVIIREDLTAQRAEVLRSAISKFGAANVWTLDGRIFWVDKRKRRRVATTLSDLEMQPAADTE